MTKEVAGTLTSVLDDKLMQAILDRRTSDSEILEISQEVLGFWDYDLFKRKPGPAYREGVFVGTDLDLACFLYALSDRGAVIELPVYKSLRPKTRTEGERVVSKQHRHGKIMGLVSNKDTFIFSVKILDANVVTTSEVGAPRNFAITKFDGDWYEGWHVIIFDPTAKENDFLTKNDLWTGNRVIFKNFVHPNRWTSFYGQYYLKTKALMQRLRDQNQFDRVLVKEMQNCGVKFPSSGKGAPPYAGRKTTKEKGSSIKVAAFEVEVDLPFQGEFVGCEFTPTNLARLSDRIREYSRIVTKLQFMTRATELAFYNRCKNSEEPMPAWIRNATWQRGYTEKGKRTAWDRLVLFQPAVGELGVSIRKRLYEKSEEVAAPTW